MTKTANDLLRESLLEVQRLRGALRKYESQTNEPIAIIAMSCRTRSARRRIGTFWSVDAT